MSERYRMALRAYSKSKGQRQLTSRLLRGMFHERLEALKKNPSEQERERLEDEMRAFMFGDANDVMRLS